MNQSIADAYNKAAEPYLKKYQARELLSEEIDLALSFVQKENPFILEIGYGGGMEAEYCLQKTNRYLGVDIAEVYQRIAQARVPQAKFVVGDIHTFALPEGIDMVLASASLIHSSKEQLGVLLQRLHTRLTHNGVILLLLKRRDGYQWADVTDAYTTRRYYYYDWPTLDSLLGDLYEVVHYTEQVRKEPWLTMIIQRR